MDLFQLLISLVIVGLIYLIGVLTGNVAPFRINIRS